MTDHDSLRADPDRMHLPEMGIYVRARTKYGEDPLRLSVDINHLTDESFGAYCRSLSGEGFERLLVALGTVTP